MICGVVRLQHTPTHFNLRLRAHGCSLMMDIVLHFTSIVLLRLVNTLMLLSWGAIIGVKLKIEVWIVREGKVQFFFFLILSFFLSSFSFLSRFSR